MPVIPPLCQHLFDRLRHLASDGCVLVANAGEAMTAMWSRDARGYPSLIVSHWGETYRINCPFCRDTRRRLWIPYQFGQVLNSGRIANSYGVCFNEDCLRDPEHREWLSEQLLGVTNAAAMRDKYAAPQIDRDRGAITAFRLTPTDWPGPCQRITELPGDHPAVQYFAGQRRFDGPTCFEYELRYCHDVVDYAHHRPAIGQVLVPIRYCGVMYGWQGRTPSNVRRDKYYTCPGMPKRFLLYNYDYARHCDFVVVVEGWTDVLRLAQARGLNRPGLDKNRNAGVALLGKRMSEHQRNLLTSTWYEKPIIICLDPDAWEQSEMAIRMIANGRNPLVRIVLPEGWDPADYDPEPIWDIILSQSRDAGVSLPIQ
jgi:hypothetical protein